MFKRQMTTAALGPAAMHQAAAVAAAAAAPSAAAAVPYTPSERALSANPVSSVPILSWVLEAILLGLV